MNRETSFRPEAALMPDGPVCDVSIVICTYNRLDSLRKTIRSLATIRGSVRFEVIVVNGPSTDGTTEWLAGEAGVAVYENDEANLARSRNIGIANARGTYVAFIDDDAIPEPDWLSRILAGFVANPDVAAVGGFIRDKSGIPFQAKYVFCDTMGREFASENPDISTARAGSRHLFPSLTGTNCVFRREDLLAIRGFDETFAYFLDETDVNLRLDRAGRRAMVVPDAEIHHKYAPSHLRGEGNVSKNMTPIARSVAYFALRHGVEEFGWQAVMDHLAQFYENEFGWKFDQMAGGVIDPRQFNTLLAQVIAGINDGIDAYFATEGVLPETNVTRHARMNATPVRAGRAESDTLRLAMLAQDHASPSMGGIGRWTNLVAKGLAELGHEVTLVGDRQPGHDHDFCELTDHGYWSHNVSGAGAVAGVEMDCLGLPGPLANVSKRKKMEIDRIDARRRFQLVSSPIWDVEGAALIGEGRRINVLSLHTTAGLALRSKPEWRENEEFFRNHVQRVLDAEYQALKRCDLILANSRAIMDDISEIYGLDLAAMPHAVVPHGVEDIPDAPSVHLPAAAATDATRVLFFGRLEERKGIEDVIELAAEMLVARPDVAFDIVGAPVEERYVARVLALEAAHPGRLVYHGWAEDGMLDALCRRADVFLGPSHYESFGLIFVEAMRYGLPCVSYAVGGVPEVIDDGRDGFAVPFRDKRALALSLEALVDKPDMRKAFSLKARANFEERFHYLTMCRRLEEVYRDLIAQSPKSGA